MRLRFASSLRRLRLPIALSLFALAALTVPARESSARACAKVIDRTYYSDATKTVIVGYCTTACNRVTNCSGTQTAYWTQVTEPCPCFFP